jgi:hypothetical protein
MACKMGVVDSCACSACFGCVLLIKMIVGSMVGAEACSEEVSGEVVVVGCRVAWFRVWLAAGFAVFYHRVAFQMKCFHSRCIF